MKDLGKAWPKVRQVRVRSKSACMRLDRESDWSPTGDSDFWSDSDEDDENMLSD